MDAPYIDFFTRETARNFVPANRVRFGFDSSRTPVVFNSDGTKTPFLLSTNIGDYLPAFGEGAYLDAHPTGAANQLAQFGPTGHLDAILGSSTIYFRRAGSQARVVGSSINLGANGSNLDLSVSGFNFLGSDATTPGGFAVTLGNATDAGSISGGSVFLQSGDHYYNSTTGADLLLSGGQQTDGGSAFLTAGNGNSAGGSVTVKAGAGPSGGLVNIIGGYSASTSGGVFIDTYSGGNIGIGALFTGPVYIKIGYDANTLIGFFDASPTPQPYLPTVPTTTEISAALVLLGLVHN